MSSERSNESASTWNGTRVAFENHIQPPLVVSDTSKHLAEALPDHGGSSKSSAYTPSSLLPNAISDTSLNTIAGFLSNGSRRMVGEHLFIPYKEAYRPDNSETYSRIVVKAAGMDRTECLYKFKTVIPDFQEEEALGLSYTDRETNRSYVSEAPIGPSSVMYSLPISLQTPTGGITTIPTSQSYIETHTDNLLPSHSEYAVAIAGPPGPDIDDVGNPPSGSLLSAPLPSSGISLQKKMRNTVRRSSKVENIRAPDDVPRPNYIEQTEEGEIIYFDPVRAHGDDFRLKKGCVLRLFRYFDIQIPQMEADGVPQTEPQENTVKKQLTFAGPKLKSCRHQCLYINPWSEPAGSNAGTLTSFCGAVLAGWAEWHAHFVNHARDEQDLLSENGLEYSFDDSVALKDDRFCSRSHPWQCSYCHSKGWSTRSDALLRHQRFSKKCAAARLVESQKISATSHESMPQLRNQGTSDESIEYNLNPPPAKKRRFC
ncbi:hypothetical protein BU17DRAFT_103641 [Hysterangium stoloniferum]|nr:hypothetical protein BU17DRAFT_103641 [Hysterangium stoloniferum]